MVIAFVTVHRQDFFYVYRTRSTQGSDPLDICFPVTVRMYSLPPLLNKRMTIRYNGEVDCKSYIRPYNLKPVRYRAGHVQPTPPKNLSDASDIGRAHLPSSQRRSSEMTKPFHISFSHDDRRIRHRQNVLHTRKAHDQVAERLSSHRL